MEELDPIVDAVLAAVRAGEPETARLLLHPYLHWTTDAGETLRGRTNVLARLRDEAHLPRPASVELRDGQIYRWVA